MIQRVLVWGGLFLLFLTVSCNMSGYNDLGEPVNRFAKLGTEATTYMRTFYTESGTAVELFSISNYRELLGSCVLMLVTVDDREVNVTLQTGVYEIENGTIAIDYTIEYAHTYRSNANPAGVPGATQYELSSGGQVQFTWDVDEAAGVIRMDDADFKKIDLIMASILSQTSSDWADRFLKMYLLCTMSAHVRIEGFGGIGMMQYIGKTTVFNGLLSGTMTFHASGLFDIESEFVYTEHGELSGIKLDGEIRNQSDMNGNGEMDGIVSFSVHGIANVWQGSVDYSHIEISNTLPSDGEYIVTVGDQSYAVDCDYGNPGNFDLTDILDVDPVNW